MALQVKPKIIMSRCIEHSACRYDGSMIKSDFVKRIKNYVDVITVCPEVDGGLTIPREAVRLVEQNGEKKLMYSMTGHDCTEDIMTVIETFLHEHLNSSVQGVILKSRSPTCGIKNVKIYAGHGRIPCLPQKSIGLFSEAIINKAPYLPLEDEGRLRNYDIRDHFLTRIFTLARFDQMRQNATMAKLVEFHSACKYLLMAYHQTEQKILGRIVANHDNLALPEVLDAYEVHLQKALAKALRKGKNTNMILHMFGYVSDYLSAEEKAFFLEELSLYNQNKKPLSAIMTVLYGWVIRFDVSYLKMQYIFKPYPIEILDVMDSGKGIS